MVRCTWDVINFLILRISAKQFCMGNINCILSLKLNLKLNWKDTRKRVEVKFEFPKKGILPEFAIYFVPKIGLIGYPSLQN